MWKFAIIFVSSMNSWSGSEELSVYYLEKPPYSYADNGKLSGFLWQKSELLLKKGQIKYEFDIRPSVRILKEIQDKRRPICSPGWFKTAERETYAWFSPPIYRDKPGVAVFHRDSESKFMKFKDLNSLLQEPGLKLGLVEGVSYGNIDPLLKLYKGPIQKTSTSIQNSLMKVAHRRIDWTMVNQEEYDYFRDQNPVEARDLMSRSFPNLPPGAQRYFMCTENLSPSLKKRLTETILNSSNGN